MRKELAALDWNENVGIKDRYKKTRHFRQLIMSKYLSYIANSCKFNSKST